MTYDGVWKNQSAACRELLERSVSLCIGLFVVSLTNVFIIPFSTDGEFQKIPKVRLWIFWKSAKLWTSMFSNFTLFSLSP